MFRFSIALVERVADDFGKNLREVLCVGMRAGGWVDRGLN